MARAQGRSLEASWANSGKLKTRRGQNIARSGEVMSGDNSDELRRLKSSGRLAMTQEGD